MSCAKLNCLVVGVAFVFAALLATGVQAELVGHFETISPSPNPTVYIQGELDDGGAGPPDFFQLQVNTEVADETQLYGDVTGLLEFVPGGDTGDGFGDFSSFTAGNIAVIDRGVTAHTNKILAAEAAGAIGVVEVNNGTATNTWLGDVQVHIPVVLLFQNVGEDLKTEMLSDPITARLYNGATPIPEPSTLVLSGVALMGLLIVGLRRRKAA